MLLLHVAPDHPLNRVHEDLRQQMHTAQESLLEVEFQTATELFDRVTADLRVTLAAPPVLANHPAGYLADMPIAQLTRLLHVAAEGAGIPGTSIPLFARNAAERIQLLSAFREPDGVVGHVEHFVEAAVLSFPRTTADIERGSNPGDVLDPYILAATQELMCSGNFESAIGATVAHKALMMIEDLLGHLHEDVIGAMRGNVRVPEPRGRDQESLDFDTNPFPGADVMQPPHGPGQPVRFHQIKSKTGSATGGGGRRIGTQLQLLQATYGGEIYFDALIGNTLRGHRSRAGIEVVSPNTIFLVGGAAFRMLTRRATGAELLLRVYQAAFRAAAQKVGYSVETMASAIVAGFAERAAREGEGVLEVLLQDVIYSHPDEQDSRTHMRRRGGRAPRPADEAP